MNTKLLIDSIVRETTVLIARLSTAAGIRAPLAQVADQVFLQLSREIEAQGVGRKVVADMFGMAIRSYQKKIQRLTDSETDQGTTLWHAMLAHLEKGSTTRQALLERFSRDPEREVLAVLADLVGSGFAYSTGRGTSARYGVTSDRDRGQMLHEDRVDSLAHVMWLEVQRNEPMPRADLLDRFAAHGTSTDEALAQLLSDGRVVASGAMLRAANFVVPLGSEHGWEAAVLDHFQTMVRAIGAKLGDGKPVAQPDDRIGGSTLSFSVYPGHPREREVYALLQTVRKLVLEVWEDVSRYNESHAIPDGAQRVSFYFGQNLENAEKEDAE